MRCRQLASVLAIAVIATGCGASTASAPASPSIAPTSLPSSETTLPPQPSPTSSPDPSGVSFGLATFPWARTHEGVAVGCDTNGVADPVYGHLRGSLTDPGPDVVWLDAPDGTHLSIVWPEGFQAEFEPALVIYDLARATFAREGDAVMAQVSRHDAAGTRADPYYASGILLAGSFTPDDLRTGVVTTGCYPRLPDVGPASFWVDPDALPLPASARTIEGFIREEACAGGMSPDGRILEPTIEYGADAIVVAFLVTKRPGEQDCPGNPAFPVQVRLAEPLGTRALLDGSEAPPRDATIQP